MRYAYYSRDIDTVPLEPVFTEPAFKDLEVKVKEATDSGTSVLCSLMLDEMAIKKHVSWDGVKFRGYVDLGTGVADDDSNPIAKDALVITAVSVTGSWKIPCGYLFINGLEGKERANW